MSFYQSSKYQFSDHALARAKKRLKLPSSYDDLLIKMHCLKLINDSYYRFEDEGHIYIQINNTDLYFVVIKHNLLIITIRPIDISKNLKIIEGNNE